MNLMRFSFEPRSRLGWFTSPTLVVHSNARYTWYHHSQLQSKMPNRISCVQKLSFFFHWNPWTTLVKVNFFWVSKFMLNLCYYYCPQTQFYYFFKLKINFQASVRRDSVWRFEWPFDLTALNDPIWLWIFTLNRSFVSWKNINGNTVLLKGQG